MMINLISVRSTLTDSFVSVFSFIRNNVRSGLVYTFSLLLGYVDFRFISRSELTKIAKNDERIWYYGDQHSVSITYPSEADTHPGLIDAVGEYTPDKSFVCDFRDVDLVGPYAIVTSHEKRVVLESAGTTRRQFGIAILKCVAQGHVLEAIELLFGLSLREAEAEIDTAVSLVGLRSKSFFHWPIEYAPQVRAIKQYMDETGNRPKILLDQNPPNWKIEYLEYLGVHPDQIVEWNWRKARVYTFIIPIHHANKLDEPRDWSPDDLRWIKSRVLENERDCSRDGGCFSSRVYISRADATTRQVVNEPELMNVLSDFGFKRYKISELTVLERAKLFYQAEVIISPHGAGLANLIFAESPIVVELFQRDLVRPTFFTLSRMFGYEYRYLLCERQNEHMRVEPDALNELLQELT